MPKIGYARVSTREQENRMQLDALAMAGVLEVYQEKASSVGHRHELERCIDGLRPGDVLVVYKLDRVARSLIDLLSILEKIKHVGAEVRSLNEPLDTTNPMGVFMLQVLGAVAQLERGIIRERSLAGQVASILRGKKQGRPRLLSDEQIDQVTKLAAAGKTKTEIGRQFEVSYDVIDRFLNPGKPRYALRRPVVGPLLLEYERVR